MDMMQKGCEWRKKKEEREEETSRYILGYGVVGREEEKGTKKEFVYYHLDEQNSTHMISNEREELENVYCYHAYGEVEEREERIENEIQYVGQQYDKGSGLYYLRARYYEPKIGRFLQEDVYRGNGLNLYIYCRNNPVMYYDPSGYVDASLNSCDKDSVASEQSIKENAETGDIKALTPRGSKLEYEVFIKEDLIAQKTYEKIRGSGLDMNEIEMFAHNTGLDIETAIKLKKHIFLTEHINLTNPKERAYFSDYFQPDMQIAHGWMKALNGELTTEEKLWFKQLADHELAEAEFMKQGVPYRDIRGIDENGLYTGDPPGAHDLAPKQPGDFPGFEPKI